MIHLEAIFFDLKRLCIGLGVNEYEPIIHITYT